MLKLRPYRVDYFDIEEMKDNDFALVRSSVVRAVTSEEAQDHILNHSGRTDGRVIIRASRFYKKLVHKQDAFKAVEDLFTANKAVKVMEQVEAYRTKKTDVPATPPVAAHVTRLSDSTLYDEVCVNCGATDAAGALDQPCTSAPAITAIPQPPVATPEQARTGPDSPATKAVVADLQGMLAHDAHEQAMDTFVPDSVPEGKRFPDPENAPINALPVLDNEATKAATPQTVGRAPTSWTYGLPGLPGAEEPLVEPDQAVGCTARPAYLNPLPPPENVVEEPFGGAKLPLWAKVIDRPAPLWVQVVVFGSVLVTVIYTILKILHH